MLCFHRTDAGGLPVATVAIDGAENAALLAIQVLAVEDATLAEKLDNARKEAAERFWQRIRHWKKNTQNKLFHIKNIRTKREEKKNEKP